MCGIVGYVGSKQSRRAEEVVLSGLSRLEYRGYDSAGIALNSPDRLVPTVIRRTGKLSALKEALETDPPPPATSAIGHTRWATHGEPSEANAHPQVSSDGSVALVHNGIIENASVLAQELRAEGQKFTSDTDTEVVVHLLARAMKDPSLPLWDGDVAGVEDEDQAQARRLFSAMLTVTRKLVGGYTLLASCAGAPHTVVAARRSSPLVIGVGEGENFLGSDALAFADYTTSALEIDQDQVVAVTPSAVTVVDRLGNPVTPKELNVDFLRDRASKDGWETFMEKEIFEQPRSTFDTLADRLDADGNLALDEVRISADVLRRADKMIIIACGTAAYAGQVARYAIEHWCRIPVEVELAHEFRYRDPVVSEKTLVVAISQSGETMDTIQAIRHARNQGARVIAIVNTPGSTIARESDALLLTHAGPEIAVASTKAFTAQVTATYILGLYLAQIRGNKYIDEVLGYLEELGEIPDKMQRVLDSAETVRQVATSMADADSVIFLGRHVGYPVAMEGALKLKEIAYIHAEGFAAGELKHGPIALVEPGMPVIIIVPTPRRPELHSKVVSNIEQVKARGATTIVVAEEGDSSVDAFADTVLRVPPAPTLFLPLLQVIPLQLFACSLASAKGLDVDQPRNLAKSVTVE
ncbi:MAG: glutamine--fructose-6-phosphate transaminase (isomerizing) [Scrofimicrobium sp.]